MCELVTRLEEFGDIDSDKEWRHVTAVAALEITRLREKIRKLTADLEAARGELAEKTIECPHVQAEKDLGEPLHCARCDGTGRLNANQDLATAEARVAKKVAEVWGQNDFNTDDILRELDNERPYHQRQHQAEEKADAKS